MARITKISVMAIVFDILSAIKELTIGVRARDNIYAKERGIEILGNAKTNEQNKIKTKTKNTS
jgi:hypothetical protein